MADDRTYIRVHDGIEDHPKIMVLSDKAFRVLVTTWAWSSKHTTDGFIPDAVWQRRATAKVRAELGTALVHGPGHDCGSCPPVPDGHVRMHDYLEHQRSAEQIEQDKIAKRRGGRLGNHKRWHVEQGITDPDCEFCAIPKPSQDRSVDRSQTGRKTSPDTDTDTDTEKEEDSLRSSSAIDEFEAFWAEYPRKDGKAAARKAWPKATKRLEAPRLVNAARYWAGLWVQAGVDKQFIPHAATWLRGERWNDEPPSPRAPNGHRKPNADDTIADLLRPQPLALPGGGSP